MNAEQFRLHCEDSIKEWAPGYTDVTDELPEQHHITLMSDDTYEATEISGIRVGKPKRFRVTVTVEEIPCE
jgi:hypothetical protein